MNSTIVPATPSAAAGFWHTFASDLGSFFTHLVSFASNPAVQKVATAGVDIGLAVTGGAAGIPIANSALAGVGELLEASQAAIAANPPGTPLTSAAVVANLNLAQSTLDTLTQTVALGAPKIAAQIGKVAAVTGALASAVSTTP